MNCAPTLTAKEFATIHNAVCELDSLCHRLEDILKPELYLQLAKARNRIREGLAGAYEQDHDAFDRKSRHFDSVKAELGITGTTWSLYEVDNLADSHPFEGVTKVIYKNHWGEKTTECAISGGTWAALWLAADACVRDSGDGHHSFIENFLVSKEDPTTLVLYTGS